MPEQELVIVLRGEKSFQAGYNAGYTKGHEDGYNAAKAESPRDWTPCAEGSPSKNDFYQTTERTRLGEIIRNVRHYGARGWQMKWGGGVTVIAWQPLPEPYNPDHIGDVNKKGAGGNQMKPPIYKPSGAALEYGDLALNIYTGCNHGCYYCFAPNVLHKTREDFAKVEPRKDIVNEVRKQLEKEQITGKLIHLCFTCDPYPADIDTTPTREIIMLLKAHGNHVQILTKGGHRAERDFDLLDANDRFGITHAGYETDGTPHVVYDSEPNAANPIDRFTSLFNARARGIKTWISFEPVLNAESVLLELEYLPTNVDVKIGKLNYHPSSINWHDFGHAAEAICKRRGLNYYIKDSLRAAMGCANGEDTGNA